MKKIYKVRMKNMPKASKDSSKDSEYEMGMTPEMRGEMKKMVDKMVKPTPSERRRKKILKELNK